MHALSTKTKSVHNKLPATDALAQKFYYRCSTPFGRRANCARPGTQPNSVPVPGCALLRPPQVPP